MDNPYRVLGLPESASDDEVKAAYKRLAKKYHPDLNNASPQAEAKMKEINEAYTQIMKGDKGGGAAYTRTWYDEGAQSESSSRLTAARNYINAGYFREALNVLSGMSEKTARWYYYSAIAHSGLGERTQSLEDARRAVSMDPNNFEYRRLLDQLEMGTRQYQQFGRNFSMPSMNISGLCMGLCLARLCCPFCSYPCC